MNISDIKIEEFLNEEQQLYFNNNCSLSSFLEEAQKECIFMSKDSYHEEDYEINDSLFFGKSIKDAIDYLKTLPKDAYLWGDESGGIYYTVREKITESKYEEYVLNTFKEYIKRRIQASINKCKVIKIVKNLKTK